MEPFDARYEGCLSDFLSASTRPTSVLAFFRRVHPLAVERSAKYLRVPSSANSARPETRSSCIFVPEIHRGTCTRRLTPAGFSIPIVGVRRFNFRAGL
jgi:hypothetical protein